MILILFSHSGDFLSNHEKEKPRHKYFEILKERLCHNLLAFFLSGKPLFVVWRIEKWRVVEDEVAPWNSYKIIRLKDDYLSWLMVNWKSPEKCVKRTIVFCNTQHTWNFFLIDTNCPAQKNKNESLPDINIRNRFIFLSGWGCTEYFFVLTHNIETPGWWDFSDISFEISSVSPREF